MKVSLFCYIYGMNNKITVYESFTEKSTGTFLKDHINTALSNGFVFYIDCNNGFSKYKIHNHFDSIRVIKTNEANELQLVFNEILKAINSSDSPPFTIIIDHFEMIEADHSSQKNMLIKSLSSMTNANVIITSIGKIEEFKISSMPSNVMCCDYQEVVFTEE